MGTEQEDGSANERLAVLRLLEQGKITATEAAQLLQALQGRSPGWRRGGPVWDPAWAEQVARSASERAQRAAARTARRGRMAAEYWGQHADEMATRAAEQAARAVEQVGEGVGRIVSHLPEYWERAARAGWGVWGPVQRLEEVVEGDLEGDAGPAGLEIQAWNGTVALHPVDGSRVRIVLKKTVPAADEAAARELAAAVTAEITGRQVTIRRAGGATTWTGGALAVEAFLPRTAVWGGTVTTDNGAIEGSGLQFRGLRFETSNGRVRLVDCRVAEVGVLTSNGSIEADGLLGRAELRTSNGSLHVRLAEEPAGAADGGAPEVELQATTTNGAIRVQVPSGMAVDVDASTSNGRFDVTGLGPHAPADALRGVGRAQLRWQTPGFNEAARRARLVLRTSNGPVRFE